MKKRLINVKKTGRRLLEPDLLQLAATWLYCTKYFLSVSHFRVANAETEAR